MLYCKLDSILVAAMPAVKEMAIRHLDGEVPMAMKMVSLRCTNCGKTITLEKGQKMCFCTYCGSQLFLDDGAVNINVTQNHNFTYRSINETKIRKAEIDRDIERRRIESSEHQQKNDYRCRWDIFTDLS